MEGIALEWRDRLVIHQPKGNSFQIAPTFTVKHTAALFLDPRHIASAPPFRSAPSGGRRAVGYSTKLIHARRPHQFPATVSFVKPRYHSLFCGFGDREGPGSLLTPRWRELDSNFPYASAMNLVSPSQS